MPGPRSKPLLLELLLSFWSVMALLSAAVFPGPFLPGWDLTLNVRTVSPAGFAMRTGRSALLVGGVWIDAPQWPDLLDWRAWTYRALAERAPADQRAILLDRAERDLALAFELAPSPDRESDLLALRKHR